MVVAKCLINNAIQKISLTFKNKQNEKANTDTNANRKRWWIQDELITRISNMHFKI
jgi:hypothetical protein